MSHNIFDYRDIDQTDLETKFNIGSLTNGDSFRESENIPTFDGEKLRFQSPWLYAPFGWGQYNTLTLSSFSNRSFPLDNNEDKKSFRRFLSNVGDAVKQHVSSQPNPDMLSTSLSTPVQYNEQFGNFQYRFPIAKKFINKDGEFEGRVFKSTNVKDLEYAPSTIKAITGKSYVSFVGYIGRVTQNKNAVRYRVIIEQICWFPLEGLASSEEEELANDSNMFLNVPSLRKKRKVTVSTTQQSKKVKGVDVDYKEENSTQV